MLTLVLSQNHFELNKTFWTQKGGVAMGSKYSPTVSNLFVEDIEIKFVNTYNLLPILWKRFIDDIFFIEELTQFIGHLNSCHPTIKFTVTISKTEVDYLDAMVKVDNEGQIYTTLYTKPTDTHIPSL